MVAVNKNAQKILKSNETKFSSRSSLMHGQSDSTVIPDADSQFQLMLKNRAMIYWLVYIVLKLEIILKPSEDEPRYPRQLTRKMGFYFWKL